MYKPVNNIKNNDQINNLSDSYKTYRIVCVCVCVWLQNTNLLLLLTASDSLIIQCLMIMMDIIFESLFSIFHSHSLSLVFYFVTDKKSERERENPTGRKKTGQFQIGPINSNQFDHSQYVISLSSSSSSCIVVIRLFSLSLD